MKQHYPKLGSSILIIFTMIGMTVVLSLILGVLFKGVKGMFPSFFLLTFNTIFVFIVAYLFVKKYYKSVFQGMFSREMNFHFIYSIIPIVIGTMMFNVVISSLIPTQQDGVYNEFMMKLASNKLYVTLFLLPIVIIAPITEELVYRGMFLRGLSGRYSSKIAILISAILFSLMHLNLAQIPNAFILGIIFSILMIHSKNIIYVIIYHMINNFMVTFGLYFVVPEALNDNPKTEEAIPIVILIVLAILGFILIYWGLKWTIKTITKEDRTVFPSNTVYSDYLDCFEEIKQT